MTITHKIHMDLVRRGIVPRLQAVQGDALTRQVEISLLADGRPWPIPGAPTVLIRYRRPDRATGEYDTLADGTPAGSTEGTAVTITLAREVLAVPGDVVLVVTLIAGGRELSTFEFLIAVQPNHSRDIFQGSDQASVTGMLPAPERAKAGQILVIEDVDEYGLIRRMKAEDALPGTTIVQIALDENQPDDTASRYKITMNDGSEHSFTVSHGKTAYRYAQEAGYTGTEAEFAQKLAGESSLIHVGPEAPTEENVCLWIDTEEEAAEVSQSDWNAAEGESGHVKNRTHYSEFSNVIFPETVVAWDDTTEYCGIMELAEPLVLGHSYKVEYNGEVFVLDARYYEGVSVYLGNKSFLGDTFTDENTGEPFVIVYVEGTAMLVGFNLQTVEPAAGSATVKITAEVVQTLPAKYLPPNSYIIRDINNSGESITVNESYDNFAELLYNGGTVYIDISNSSGVTRVMITSAVFTAGGLTMLTFLNGKEVAVWADNGTWTPPGI